MRRGPHLMRAWERRGLTGGEIALARDMFSDDIDWGAVRIVQIPALFFYAMVPLGNTVVYAKLDAWRDFADAPTEEQGIFIHELTHVWQASQGRVLAIAKLWALGREAYRYKMRSPSDLSDYNIESQAEIARHLFSRRIGKPDREAPPRDWLEDIWARR